MSLYGALYSGVSGLDAQSSAMGAIADNISNVNTVGYKGTDINFSTLVTTQVSTTQYSPGGVQSLSRSGVNVQGLLQATNASTDVALSGQGFFIVNSVSQPASEGGMFQYTRAGSFTSDSSGYLKNASNFYLMGWPLTPSDGSQQAGANQVTVNGTTYMKAYKNSDGSWTYINQNIVNTTNLRPLNLNNIGGKAEATSQISMGVNLPSGDAVYDPNNPSAGGYYSTSVQTYDSLGDTGNSLFNWTKTTANAWSLGITPPAGCAVANVSNYGEAYGNLVYASTGQLEFSAIPAVGSSFRLGSSTTTTTAVAGGGSTSSTNSNYVTVEFYNSASGGANPTNDNNQILGVDLNGVTDAVGVASAVAGAITKAANTPYVNSTYPTPTISQILLGGVANGASRFVAASNVLQINQVPGAEAVAVDCAGNSAIVESSTNQGSIAASTSAAATTTLGTLTVSNIAPSGYLQIGSVNIPWAAVVSGLLTSTNAPGLVQGAATIQLPNGPNGKSGSSGTEPQLAANVAAVINDLVGSGQLTGLAATQTSNTVLLTTTTTPVTVSPDYQGTASNVTWAPSANLLGQFTVPAVYSGSTNAGWPASYSKLTNGSNSFTINGVPGNTVSTLQVNNNATSQITVTSAAPPGNMVIGAVSIPWADVVAAGVYTIAGVSVTIAGNAATAAQAAANMHSAITQLIAGAALPGISAAADNGAGVLTLTSTAPTSVTPCDASATAATWTNVDGSAASAGGTTAETLSTPAGDMVIDGITIPWSAARTTGGTTATITVNGVGYNVTGLAAGGATSNTIAASNMAAIVTQLNQQGLFPGLSVSANGSGLLTFSSAGAASSVTADLGGNTDETTWTYLNIAPSAIASTTPGTTSGTVAEAINESPVFQVGTYQIPWSQIESGTVTNYIKNGVVGTLASSVTMPSTNVSAGIAGSITFNVAAGNLTAPLPSGSLQIGDVAIPWSQIEAGTITSYTTVSTGAVTTLSPSIALTNANLTVGSPAAKLLANVTDLIGTPSSPTTSTGLGAISGVLPANLVPTSNGTDTVTFTMKNAAAPYSTVPVTPFTPDLNGGAGEIAAMTTFGSATTPTYLGTLSPAQAAENIQTLVSNLSNTTTGLPDFQGLVATYSGANVTLTMVSPTNSTSSQPPPEVVIPDLGGSADNTGLANVTWADSSDGTNASTGAKIIGLSGSYATTGQAISFNGDGTPASIIPNAMQMFWANGAENQNGTQGTSSTQPQISLNLGAVNQSTGVTQLGGGYQLNFMTQNGAKFGNFSGVSIGTDGIVTALFDNGVQAPVFQIPIATFADPDGLQSVTGNTWIATSASGSYTLRPPGQAGSGTVQASQLEQSTVDLGTEFTNMIVVQRAYSAAAKIITTTDSMLNTLVNIIQG